MKFAPLLAAAGLIVASFAASPVMADPGNGKGHGRHAGKHEQREGRGPERDIRVRHVSDCPPGLARKNPPCVPPGQAGRGHDGIRVGDVLRTGDYVVLRDPRRYDLETRRGWDYYRDNNSIYRVDSYTRKILAVINLIDAFSN